MTEATADRFAEPLFNRQFPKLASGRNRSAASTCTPPSISSSNFRDANRCKPQFESRFHAHSEDTPTMDNRDALRGRHRRPAERALGRADATCWTC